MYVYPYTHVLVKVLCFSLLRLTYARFIGRLDWLVTRYARSSLACLNDIYLFTYLKVQPLCGLSVFVCSKRPQPAPHGRLKFSIDVYKFGYQALQLRLLRYAS